MSVRRTGLEMALFSWRFTLILAVTFFGAGAFAANNFCSGLALGVSPRSQVVVDKMMSEDFDETDRIAKAIIKFASLPTNEFVMLGRSPTMLAAYFEAITHLSPVAIWTLPISLRARRIPRAELILRLEHLFEVYRSDVPHHEKPLVIIDEVEEGRTFIELDRALGTMGKKAQYVALSDNAASVEEHLRLAGLVNPWRVLPISHRYMLHVAAHKEAAKYSSFAVGEPVDTVPRSTKLPVANPTYLYLRLRIEKALGYHE